ncbi:MAG: hypothetical protein HC905_31095 [Bacteroidales bacterium]|nr:hypothetical protein [Bacteroidales bacterium]
MGKKTIVSIDNKFLFFTKMIFNQTGLAESDIYWVSTQRLFKPFVFNPISVQTIKLDKETEILLPTDYFKDIDNENLEISLNHEKFDWVKFDNEKSILTLDPNEIGEFDLIFTAVDKYSNEMEDKVKIIVDE